MMLQEDMPSSDFEWRLPERAKAHAVQIDVADVLAIVARGPRVNQQELNRHRTVDEGGSGFFVVSRWWRAT